MTASFHKSQKQSSLNERHSLTELRVICTIPGQLERLTVPPPGLSPLCRNKSRKVKINELKWVFMKGRNTEHRD